MSFFRECQNLLWSPSTGLLSELGISLTHFALTVVAAFYIPHNL